jgi:hypothetical protein
VDDEEVANLINRRCIPSMRQARIEACAALRAAEITPAMLKTL